MCYEVNLPRNTYACTCIKAIVYAMALLATLRKRLQNDLHILMFSFKPYVSQCGARHSIAELCDSTSQMLKAEPASSHILSQLLQNAVPCAKIWNALVITDLLYR
jgi:hypothetical protein